MAKKIPVKKNSKKPMSQNMMNQQIMLQMLKDKKMGK